jgi:hypothetical protein
MTLPAAGLADYGIASREMIFLFGVGYRAGSGRAHSLRGLQMYPAIRISRDQPWQSKRASTRLRRFPSN